MKYKIGNVEVEAVQWKGDNLEEVGDFISKYSFSFEINKYANHTKVNLNHSELNKGEYIIVSHRSRFTLSEQDFINMATKVKETKFKVGDKVYYASIHGANFDCDKSEIEYITFKEGEPRYGLWGMDYEPMEEELFTLEEAIEKLKEL